MTKRTYFVSLCFNNESRIFIVEVLAKTEKIDGNEIDYIFIADKQEELKTVLLQSVNNINSHRENMRTESLIPK